MSKRKVNKQQAIRIAKKQSAYQMLPHEDLNDGLVLARFGRRAEIEDQQGLRISCSIRPHLETLVAGDKVIWQSEGINEGTVVSIYPRSSVLVKGNEKPVAANITQLVIVLAPKPEISWSLLDSYLLIAEMLNLNALVVLNKCDLPCEEIKNTLLKHYQSLEYSILYVQKNKLETYVGLQTALSNHVNVFVGQSGVGKSSIISQILPSEDIVIGEISEISALGKHTTSNSRFYHLPGGGALIDSPGVREFSLESLNKQMLLQGYKEFKSFLPYCKFRNCNHIDTLGCALLEAYNQGKLSALRYENFKKLAVKITQ